MNKILLIEDDKGKIDAIKSLFDNYEIIVKESFQSGMAELKSNYTNYTLLILDMTIPLWEKGNNDLGGNYERFGGENVLKEMKRRNLKLPTILFTMFDIFPTNTGNITFEEINQIYKNDYSDFYIDAVFYSSNEENWKDTLKEIITNFTKKQ